MSCSLWGLAGVKQNTATIRSVFGQMKCEGGQKPVRKIIKRKEKSKSFEAGVMEKKKEKQLFY